MYFLYLENIYAGWNFLLDENHLSKIIVSIWVLKKMRHFHWLLNANIAKLKKSLGFKKQLGILFYV